MRALSLAVGLALVWVMAQAAPGQGIQGGAPGQLPQPVLQGATADTITVPHDVLQRLTVSEPEIVVPEGAPRDGIVWLKVLVSKTGDVEEVVTLQGEGALREAAVDAVRAWKYKPFVKDGEPREIQSTILLSFNDGVGKYAVASLGGMAGPPSGVALGPGRSGPMRVSAGVIAGLMEHAVAPVYPPLAKAAHVQGIVVLHAILSKTGEIEDLQVVSGPPMLTGAAVEAVKQWQYRPYLLNGVPVEVDTTINVNFTFAKPKTADAPDGTAPSDPK